MRVFPIFAVFRKPNILFLFFFLRQFYEKLEILKNSNPFSDFGQIVKPKYPDF